MTERTELNNIKNMNKFEKKKATSNWEYLKLLQ